MVSYQSSRVCLLGHSGFLFLRGRLRSIVRSWSLVVCSVGIASLTGCAGMNGLSNSLGINSASRVPPPATGSFTIPNTYTNGAPGANGVSGVSPSNAGPASPTLGALQSNNVGSGIAYGDQVLSSVNRIQSRIQDTSNQVRDGVVRTTDALNSRVEQASAKVNRIGEGVVQAGAIISDSLEEASNIPAPITPAPIVSSSGVVQDPNASWRNPTTVR
jgi:hypothetical protein